MKWTFANLMIQTGSGLVGSNIAAAAAHEHRFVAANGSLNDLTHVQITASQAPTGAVVGAIAMMRRDSSSRNDQRTIETRPCHHGGYTCIATC